MTPPPTSPARLPQQAAHWQGSLRWLQLAALISTVPAFYLELLTVTPSPLAGFAYGVAALMVALVMAQEYGQDQQPQRGDPQVATASGSRLFRRRPLGVWLSLPLMLGLLLAAVLPSSSGSGIALGVRSVTALLTLAQVVWSMQHLLARGSLPVLLTLALAVLALCGFGFWWLEPRALTLADGLWLAFTTAATVGYGDIVPSTPAAKIFSVFVVLLGYGVLSLVTAAIAAMWVESKEREIEREILHDLHRQIRALRDEVRALRPVAQASAMVGAPPSADGHSAQGASVEPSVDQQTALRR